jgi:transcriptional regulator with XRE-family HTH domain
MVWYPNPRDPQQQQGFELFGRMLRRRRVFLGWTQRQLEARSGLDQTVISRLENGKQYGLRWSKLAELISALGGLDVGPVAPEPFNYLRERPGMAERPGASESDMADERPGASETDITDERPVVPRVDLTGGMSLDDDPEDRLMPSTGISMW